MQKKLSFPKDKIRVLLLEGIHSSASDRFNLDGYSSEMRKEALNEKELIEIIPHVHLLGVRSKTLVTQKVIEAGKNLLAVGCFCIGTDQVDLESAAAKGVPVFNAPFSNTRSVAELTLAEVVMLARRAAHKSNLLHQGIWEKSAEGCVEVRNKTIGIIGYGHIGPQVGILAEAFGMQVVFYDVITKLPLGNATAVNSLGELLSRADFVTLHVPETADTRGMIGAKELATMKRGAMLLNLSRGRIVDLPALKAAIESGHLGGAAIDVFPDEPRSNDEPFVTELQKVPNVILTPHIGGSTFEAQKNIGIEVATSLTKFTDTGSTTGAVNFPEVELPIVQTSHRILNIHHNVPGVLSGINTIIAQMGGNIRAQYLSTRNDIGYLIIDVDSSISRAVKSHIEALPDVVTSTFFASMI